MISQTLINQLSEITNSHLLRTEVFLRLNDDQLNNNSENQWTVLECFEHLNSYFDYYLPKIREKINSSKIPSKENYSPGLIGNYLAKTMLPNDKMRKMKSPADKNPVGKNLNKKVILKLTQNFKLLLSLLEDSRTHNLEKIKIPTSISTLVKMKLGDTFQFIVNHNERHMVQAENLIKKRPS